MQPDGTVYPYPGEVYLLDRAVDPETGTIKARLIFQNPKNELKPGITTNVRVKHGSGDASLLIPYKSVIEQLGEYFVYTINQGHAIQRKVTLGSKIEDKVVVRDGVKQGDSVVTEGVQKLKDSILVRTGPPPAPAPAAK
jgi:membrane fusion protein (multidrug efflux system)